MKCHITDDWVILPIDNRSDASANEMLNNEKAAKLFNSAATLPVIKSMQSCISSSSHFSVVLTCGTKDYQVEKKEKLYQHLVVDKNGNLLSKSPYLSASDEEQDSYIDGNFKVSLISTGIDAKRVVKVYQEDGSITLFNVTKDHGPFYTDCGQITVSSSKERIFYVAQPPADEGDSKFHFECDPGEGYTGRKPSAIVVLNLLTKKVKTLNFDSIYAASYPIIDPSDEDSLYFIGVKNLPTRLGIRYCTNRASFLFKCKTDGSELEMVSGRFGNARTPLLSPKKEHIIFLSNQLGGPHESCARLISFDLKTKQEILIVDKVGAAEKKEDFPGLFLNPGLQPDCWVNDHVLIVCSTWRSKSAIVAIDISNGIVKNLTTVGTQSWSLLRVRDSTIFATCSSLSSFPQLAIRDYGLESSDWKLLESTKVPSSVQTLLTSFNYQVKEIAHNVEIILVEPSGPSIGLIVLPHGGFSFSNLGPHSCLTTSFSVSCFTFLSQGLSVLLVNYTGSTGFGDDSIYGLVGEIGVLEVAEVHQAAVWAVSELKCSKIFVHGGSHGGFIAAHLVSQHPDFYAGAVIRNPVINVGGMPFDTDIPDWCFAEAGLMFDPDHPKMPSPEEYKKLYECSPARFAENGGQTSPVLLMLGDNDRRVPHSQALRWAETLKGNGSQVQVLMFPGNGHALESLDAERYGVESASAFFQSLM